MIRPGLWTFHRREKRSFWITLHMNPTRLLTFLALSCFLSFSAIFAADPSAPADPDDLSAITWKNGMWPNRPAEQQAAVDAIGKDCKILLLGDSNTHGWGDGRAKFIWDHYFSPRGAINFGIGGDTTNGIRARLRDTNWGACQPPITVILSGTNDRGDKPDVRAKKIKLLVTEVFSHFPKTKVLLLSIPPCGLDEHEALTTSYFATNDIIKTYADGQKIFYIDLAKTMTWEEGLGYSGLGGDRLHLDELGRLRWAELMEPIIAQTLNEQPKKDLPHPLLPEYTGDPKAPKILIAGDGAAPILDFRISLQNELKSHKYSYHLVGPYTDPKTPPDFQGLHFGIFSASLAILQKVVPPVTKKYSPDILLLFAGFGEVNYGKNGTENLASQVEKVLDDTIARAPSTQIVLSLITPHSSPEKNATIIAANQNLLTMLKARAAAGKGILYADSYSAIDSTMLSQGYLPHKAGLLRAASNVSPTIEAILNKSTASRPIGAPTKVTAVPQERGSQINWQAVSDATRYNVKRSMKEGGPYAIIATDVKEMNFKDTNVRSDTDYYYVVSGADAQGQGKDSAEVKVSAPAPANVPAAATP